MAALIAVLIVSVFVTLTYVAWKRYLWASQPDVGEHVDARAYSLTDVFDDRNVINIQHQKGAEWLTDIFSNTAKQFPNHIALQIPHTGESLSFVELNARAEHIADALAAFVNGPDQVVAVAMSQDNWQIVAAHLAVLKAGGTVMFVDTTLPDALTTHMLNDARPVVVLTRGENQFRELPTLDVLALPENTPKRTSPTWLDDPTERLATIFYTSGTTGLPKGVECPHAGYVNLARTYADYFDLLPGMDATSLTSSLGYDGSISEMYSAWVSGCTVVLLTKEQIRSGPDLVPILRDSEVTVLFCPPVLLTTLSASPEIDLPYPICRYIVPAGEAFPNALVEPWTRARRQIINTYGPTEASTDTSRQTLRPGEPITIGSPFPNVTYVILEVDDLKPLPLGEIGELCIGGVHLARGYRNLPEQTAEKFITHPEFGRLYRTGDKCRIDPVTHQVDFLGRIDAQLKVRGHRVEAQAVEDILQSQFSEIEAAVLDYQNDALVAFVCAPGISSEPISVATRAPAVWAERVIARLAEQLPDPSVPSQIFLVETFIMKPVSGKIDRKVLPDLSRLSTDTEKARAGEPPDLGMITRKSSVSETGGTEADLDQNPDALEVLKICREIFETPLRWDDAFAKSGGHSINIARLAQRLQASGWQVSVRALLSEYNSARKIAQLPRIPISSAPIAPRQAAPRRAVDQNSADGEVLSVTLFTTLQVLFALFLSIPGLIAFFSVFAFVEIGTFFTTASVSAFVIVGCGLYFTGLTVPFLTLLWALCVKFLIGGHIYENNIRPGAYPKWSRMHLRVWCIGRVQNMVLMPLGAMYRSAPLMAFALRQLGARVGKNLQCAQDADLAGPLDLLTFDDNVAIQTGAYIHTVRWSGQYLLLGPIHLERDCKVGMRAGVANDVTVGQGAWITPFSPVLTDVGAHEMWEGAPARVAGRYTKLKRTTAFCEETTPFWRLETLNIAMQIAMTLVLTVIPASLILWQTRQFIPAGEAELSGKSFTAILGADGTTAASGEATNASNYFLVTPLPEILWQLGLYTFITAWVTIVVTSILGCIFVRLTAAAPGLCSSQGLKGALLLYRLNILNGIQGVWTWTITGQYLRALAGLRFPKLGASECDILFNLVPEVTLPDSQVFWSNGSFCNVLDYGADHLALRSIDMPRNFFSGNNCVAEHGHFPDNFLLGVSTPCSDILYRNQMRTRPGVPITVAGNPPLEFASASFEDENKAHKPPSFSLFLGRVCLNDIFSIGTLRIAEVLIFTLLYICAQRLGVNAIVSALLAIIVTEVGLLALCIAVKQALVGNKWGTNHQTPFWSWRHFNYFFAQDCFFIWCQGLLGLLAGTVLANPILRRLGCQVGDRTLLIDPMQCSDWNAVRFGDDCVVGGFLQFHTFENMTLKVKETHIGDRSTVAFGATVMSGAKIDCDSTLQPLSMVLKEVYLQPDTYAGSPADRESDAMLRASVGAQHIKTLQGDKTPTAEPENVGLKDEV